MYSYTENQCDFSEKKNLKGIICLNVQDWHFNDMRNWHPKLHIQQFHLLRPLRLYLLFTPKGRTPMHHVHVTMSNLLGV